jgi:ribosome-associated protein
VLTLTCICQCSHIFILEGHLEANELAHAVIDIMANKKAANILMLDMREVTLLADYYILCDGLSTRQINAVADALFEELKKGGTQSPLVEGTPESGWMLIDFGSVVVHIFSPEKRAYYRLEELWHKAPIVVRMI